MTRKLLGRSERRGGCDAEMRKGKENRARWEREGKVKTGQYAKLRNLDKAQVFDSCWLWCLMNNEVRNRRCSNPLPAQRHASVDLFQCLNFAHTRVAWMAAYCFLRLGIRVD